MSSPHEEEGDLSKKTDTNRSEDEFHDESLQESSMNNDKSKGDESAIHFPEGFRDNTSGRDNDPSHSAYDPSLSAHDPSLNTHVEGVASHSDDDNKVGFESSDGFVELDQELDARRNSRHDQRVLPEDPKRMAKNSQSNRLHFFTRRSNHNNTTPMAALSGDDDESDGDFAHDQDDAEPNDNPSRMQSPFNQELAARSNQGGTSSTRSIPNCIQTNFERAQSNALQVSNIGSMSSNREGSMNMGSNNISNNNIAASYGPPDQKGGPPDEKGDHVNAGATSGPLLTQRQPAIPAGTKSKFAEEKEEVGDGIPGAYAAAPRYHMPPVMPTMPSMGSDSEEFQNEGPAAGDAARNAGLVEARAVKSESNVMNTEVSRVDPAEEEARRVQRKKQLVASLAGLCLLVVGITLVALYFGGVFEGDSVVYRTDQPTTMPPTVAPTPFVLPLPDYTMEAIQSDPNSPQSLAYQWLKADPVFDAHIETTLLQRFALATFYYATNGFGWTVNEDWMSYEVHECNWHTKSIGESNGVCDQDGNYTALVLTKNGLGGALPPELALLSHLEVMDVATNQIGGSIPSEMGLMTAMEELILDFNRFVGTVPLQITQLSLLEFFFVHTNAAITGTIHTQMGLLTNMLDLEWGGTQTQGTIPSELGLLTQLTKLYLSDQKLEGRVPPELYLLTTISDVLTLDNNALTGTIQTEIGLFIDMKHFWVHESSFSGPIPSQVGLLKELEILFFHGNQFTGTFPTQIGGLSKLNQLTFAINAIAGAFPSELGMLGDLSFLYADQNQITGTLPTQIGMLSEAGNILISMNKLKGPIPSQVGLLENLNNLHLAANELSGTIPTQIGSLSKLQGLFAEYNPLITGTLPLEMARLTDLGSVILEGTNINGSIPSEFGLLSTLVLLSLSETTLVGSIPSELGQLGLLEWLSVHSTSISGQIPEELGGLANSLSTFLTYNTLVSGTVPADLCSVSVLMFNCSESLCGCNCACR